MTWVFPGTQGTPVRLFTRDDVPVLTERLTQGKREQFLSMLSLLRGAARKENAHAATEKLNLSSLSILHEQEQATRRLVMARLAMNKLASGLALSPEERVVLDELQEGGTKARREVESQFEGTKDKAQVRSMEIRVSPEAEQQMVSSLLEPIRPPLPRIPLDANATRSTETRYYDSVHCSPHY